jgi:hypothetical protein
MRTTRAERVAARPGPGRRPRSMWGVRVEKRDWQSRKSTRGAGHSGRQDAPSPAGPERIRASVAFLTPTHARHRPARPRPTSPLHRGPFARGAPRRATDGATGTDSSSQAPRMRRGVVPLSTLRGTGGPSPPKSPGGREVDAAHPPPAPPRPAPPRCQHSLRNAHGSLRRASYGRRKGGRTSRTSHVSHCSNRDPNPSRIGIACGPTAETDVSPRSARALSSSSRQHRSSAERERLDHVRPAADAAPRGSRRCAARR